MLGDAGAQELADGLVHLSSRGGSLSALEVAGNRIGEGGVGHLANAIGRVHTLRQLDLSGNRIGGAAEKLSSGLMGNPALCELRLGDAGLQTAGAARLTKVLDTSQSLVELHLWRNALSADAASALANTLTVNRTLTVLSLRRNDLRDEGIQHIASALVANRALARLDVAGNGITDEGFAKLATVRVPRASWRFRRLTRSPPSFSPPSACRCSASSASWRTWTCRPTASQRPRPSRWPRF